MLHYKPFIITVYFIKGDCLFNNSIALSCVWLGFIYFVLSCSKSEPLYGSECIYMDLIPCAPPAYLLSKPWYQTIASGRVIANLGFSVEDPLLLEISYCLAILLPTLQGSKT